MAKDTPLKLLATDADDLAVISAMLQDALVPVTEMSWRAGDGRFALVANRFRWEGAPDRDRQGAIRERVHAGLCFEQVRKVSRRGFDPRHGAGLLSLLAIRCEAGADGETVVELTFAGGPEVRLQVARIACHLEDIDQPWPTRHLPAHPDTGAEG
ncbi:MAG: DUF2948 family protein [Alphaproteobacteria bacterium]